MITAERPVPNEEKTINELFEAGLRKLHIRKPHDRASDTRLLINRINKRYLDRVILHEHHDLVIEMDLGGFHIKSDGIRPKTTLNKHVSKSFHALSEVSSYRENLRYGFLSPIFDSISKIGYRSGFGYDTLRPFLRGFKSFPIYALGGVTPERISDLRSLGFAGTGVLGAIWEKESTDERLEVFDQLTNG